MAASSRVIPPREVPDAGIFWKYLMPRWWADQVAVLALELARQPDLPSTLDAIVRHASTSIEGAEFAAITVKGRNGTLYRTVASSDDVPLQVDQLQYDSGEGPCLSALAQGLTIRSDDIATDHRWPMFGPAAHDLTGVTSMLSHPLFLEQDDTLGALNLYAKKPGAFDWDSANGLTVLATHSAIAMARAAAQDQSEQLRIALQSNRTIGVAMGILMNKHLMTQAQAFDALRVSSQHGHRKLIDIATDVVETGQLILPDKTPLTRSPTSQRNPS
jgi:transcriptional regulator with GAF, ATPase, and Fis domain